MATLNPNPGRRPRSSPGATFVCALVAGWTFWSVSARAQLGSSPAEVARLYGPVFRPGARVWHRQIYDSGALDGDIYRKDAVYIRAVFRQGRVVLLEFSRMDGAFKQSEIDAALSASAANAGWETGRDSTDEAKYYRRRDNLAIAQWAVGLDGSLLISAEEPGRLGDKLLP